MQVSIYEKSTELGAALAGEICNQLVQAQQEQRRYLLGCPGGRSPKPVYEALATYIEDGDLDLSNLTVVMMDDYLEGDAHPFRHVDIDAHFSCRRFAMHEIAAVFNRSRKEAQRLHSENIWFPNPADSAAYDERIATAGGIDMFILASGASDGHVAFNPPGTQRDSLSRVTKLAELTRQDNMKTFPGFGSLSDVPRYGVTVGVGTIADQSKSAAMVVFGESKRRAFNAMVQAESYNPDWPATIITECKNATLYADVAAAGRTAG